MEKERINKENTEVCFLDFLFLFFPGKPKGGPPRPDRGEGEVKTHHHYTGFIPHRCSILDPDWWTAFPVPGRPFNCRLISMCYDSLHPLKTTLRYNYPPDVALATQKQYSQSVAEEYCCSHFLLFLLGTIFQLFRIVFRRILFIRILQE